MFFGAHGAQRVLAAAAREKVVFFAIGVEEEAQLELVLAFEAAVVAAVELGEGDDDKTGRGEGECERGVLGVAVLLDL